MLLIILVSLPKSNIISAFPFMIWYVEVGDSRTYKVRKFGYSNKLLSNKHCLDHLSNILNRDNVIKNITDIKVGSIYKSEVKEILNESGLITPLLIYTIDNQFVSNSTYPKYWELFAKHKEVQDLLFRTHGQQPSMIEIIRNFTYSAIFGAYPLD